MDRRLTMALAILAAVAAASIFLAPAEGADAQDTVEGEVTFRGYVSAPADGGALEPLRGVAVTLYEGSREVSSATTGADGMFSFTVDYDPSAGHHLGFGLEGYAVWSLPDRMEGLTAEGLVSFEILPDMLDAATGEYVVADASEPVAMAVADGSVNGSVYGEDGEPIQGAYVMVVSARNVSYVQTTGADGSFSLECPAGEYSLRVSCEGYETARNDVSTGIPQIVTMRPLQPPVSGNITFYGYVSNLSDQEGNTPLEGAGVTLYTDDEKLASATTDAEGRFSFTVDYDPYVDHYLKFEFSGYTVRALPDPGMTMVENDYVRFEVGPDMRDDAGEYALTGPANGLQAIGMALTNGVIFGNVHDTDGKPVSGASVTLVSASGQSYPGTTDANGYFSVECPYGEYTLSVTCNGFRASGNQTVSTGHGQAYPVVLERYESQLLFGLDSAHTTLVIGLTLVLVVVLSLALLLKRGRDPESGIVIENDLDRSDGDDVRRP